MKKLIICCDGTWQNSDGGTLSHPSNITRLTRALLPQSPTDSTPQIVFYQAGIGTSSTPFSALTGATGSTLPENLREAYGFLALNYHPGDTVHLFGFSRGAYTARCIAGLITKLGVLTKKGMDQFYQIYDEFQRNGLDDPDGEAWVKKLRAEEDMVNWPVNVTTIGCFDTVGALGIPTLPIPGLRDIVAGVNTRKYQFLDTELNQGVLNAFHALALDERRRPFTPTLWRKKKSEHNGVNLKQCWFPGAHTNVGGGYEDQEIADITLAWMIQQCEPWLAFDRRYLASIVSNRGDGNGPGEWVSGHIVDSWRGFHVLGGVKRRTPGRYGDGTEETIHPSVRLRMAAVKGWKCKALNGWRWEDGVWIGPNGEVLREEKLGDWEVQLAGKELVDKVMIMLHDKRVNG